MSKIPKHVISSETRKNLESQLSAEISHIARLAKDQLRMAWAGEFHKEPPKSLSRDLLLRMLAWRLQENAFGGHDRATLNLLNAYARGQGDVSMFRRLKSGTVLVREYQGIRHTVTISPDGYIWENKAYRSLSVIARAITGANWNGPRFFGLRVNHEKEKQVEATL